MIVRFLIKIFAYSFLGILSNDSIAATITKGTKLSSHQILNVGIGSDVPTLDPQKMEDNTSIRVVNDLFEPLMTYDDSGNLIFGVADSYTVSKDNLTYTFHLRENVLFSNGSPITVEDVVYSFQRLLDPKVASPYNHIAFDIKNAALISENKMPLSSLGVKVTDKSHISIQLEHPVPYFLRVISFASFSIVNKQNVQKYGDAFTQPANLVSSGAYTLKKWTVGDKLSIEKNNRYWNKNNTIIEKVNFYPVVDENTELQMYEAGQLDFTFFIPAEKFKSLKAKIPDEVHNHPYLSIYYLDLNNNAAPFKDNVNLRKAFSLVIDRDVITKYITKRGETPSYDLVPTGTANYTKQNPEWAQWPMEKRISEAQKLYKEAGYSEEKPLKLNFYYNTNLLHKSVALAAASMWQKAFGAQGLKVELLNQEWKVFLKSRQNGEYQIARDGWIGDFNDASSFLTLLSSKNVQNNSKYKNQTFDSLISKASVEMNEQKRQEILQNASRQMQAEYPIIPLFDYVTAHLVKPYVGGYTGKNSQDSQFSREFYIKEI
jgi:oligopeptide transport system substrate-binding protein